MKNGIYILAFLVCLTSFGQKKKSATTKTAAGLAKVDNLIAEVKNGNFQVTITDKGKEVDAIVVKSADKSFAPTGCKLTSFKASGASLYLLSWQEKTNTKTPTKTEDIVTIYTKVYDITIKKEVFSNYQITNNITEQVFLDKNKTASETQNKIRREGFEFTLNPDGSITQKSKNQENKWVYDATKKEYLDAKKKK